MGILVTRLLPALCRFGLPVPVASAGLGLLGRSPGLLERDGFRPARAGDRRCSVDGARTGFSSAEPGAGHLQVALGEH